MVTMAKLPANNARLIELRDKFRLSRREIADLICMSRSAVDTYLYPHAEPHFRELPDGPLKLLEFELGLRKSVRFRSRAA